MPAGVVAWTWPKGPPLHERDSLQSAGLKIIGGQVIKVSVFYPNGPDIHFDMAYYVGHHMKMVQRLVGPALRGSAVEQGVSGTEPGSPPLYIALGHLMFDSVADFQSSFGAHAAEIVADVPHYTNSQPIIQISEVKL